MQAWSSTEGNPTAAEETQLKHACTSSFCEHQQKQFFVGRAVFTWLPLPQGKIFFIIRAVLFLPLLHLRNSKS
jgi:hypothetical protein